MPKVSVIVPVYNGEQTIARCLTSLTEQTLDDIEIIVVDNCSTDGTVEIVKNFPVRLIINKENLGQNYSMNVGLDASTGEYIAECDADDFVRPDMYERLYEVALGADVVKCGFVKCAGGVMDPFLPLGTSERSCCPRFLTPKGALEILSQWVHLQSAIYRREFILDYDLRFRLEGCYEDTSLHFKIVTAARRYKYIPEALYFYTMDNPLSGTATIKNTFAVCEQYEEIKRWNEKYHLHRDKEIARMRFSTYRWNYFRLPDSEKSTFLIRAAQDFQSDTADREMFTADQWNIYTAMRGD